MLFLYVQLLTLTVRNIPKTSGYLTEMCGKNPWPARNIKQWNYTKSHANNSQPFWKNLIWLDEFIYNEEVLSRAFLL